MNKNLIAIAVLAASAFSTQVLAVSGTVNFTGEITETGCEVTVDTKNQTVDLGKIWVNDLAKDTATTGKNFHLILTNCPTTYTVAKIRFDGDSVEGGETKLLDLENAGQGGVAKGVAIQIKDDKGTAINLREESKEYPIEPGTVMNKLDFSAAYYAYATPEAGLANAVATFDIIY